MTKYLNDKKTHAAINSKLFKELNYVNDALVEAELTKQKLTTKNHSLCGFFIPQYVKVRMLELTKFSDVDKFEELEIDTDSLYLALAEKELEDCS